VGAVISAEHPLELLAVERERSRSNAAAHWIRPLACRLLVFAGMSHAPTPRLPECRELHG